MLDDILAEYGKEMTWEMKAQLMGKRGSLFQKVLSDTKATTHFTQIFLAERDAASHLLSFFPDISLTMEDYLRRKDEAQDRIWPTVPLLPGVEKLVHHLKKHGIPMAIATASRRRNYLRKTSGARVRSVFEHFDIKENVVTGDPLPDIPGPVAIGQRGVRKGRGKPHPDIFLVAAKECLGRDVGDISTDLSIDLAENVVAERKKGLVFEDAIHGVAAANRGGMNGGDQQYRLGLFRPLIPLLHSYLGSES